MRVLLVDTAGSEGGVLLARNDSDACEATATEILGAMRLEPREFSTQLISSIAKLLQATSLELSMLDALGVVSGPGSFTGLRIGLSAVKAIAEATGKPVIAISRLATMASAAVRPEDSAGETVHAILDAGRGEFYHGTYRDAGRTRLAESLQTLETLTAAMKSTPGRMIASEPNVLASLSTLGEGLPQL
ncbi:MAG: tRNA (adenosine(37)-N6)-threonylcarbamoyltransferase complex dimerization subunit type 1 TsaB, partial [Acidobacteriaceae bacterium]